MSICRTAQQSVGCACQAAEKQKNTIPFVTRYYGTGKSFLGHRLTRRVRDQLNANQHKGVTQIRFSQEETVLVSINISTDLDNTVNSLQTVVYTAIHNKVFAQLNNCQPSCEETDQFIKEYAWSPQIFLTGIKSLLTGTKKNNIFIFLDENGLLEADTGTHNTNIAGKPPLDSNEFFQIIDSLLDEPNILIYLA